MNGKAISCSYHVTDNPGIFTQGNRSVTLAQVLNGLCDILAQIYWGDLQLERDECLKVTFTPVTERWDFHVKAEWAVEKARR